MDEKIKLAIIQKATDLTKSDKELEKVEGYSVLFAIDNIKCTACLDTTQTWHKRYKRLAYLDMRGRYDYDNCFYCRDGAWNHCSYHNDIKIYDTTVFHSENFNWELRYNELKYQSLNNPYIQKLVLAKISPDEKPDNYFVNPKTIGSPRKKLVQRLTNDENIEYTNRMINEFGFHELDDIRPSKISRSPTKRQKTKSSDSVISTSSITAEDDMMDFDVLEKQDFTFNEKEMNLTIDLKSIINNVVKFIETAFGDGFQLFNMIKELEITINNTIKHGRKTKRILKHINNNFLFIKIKSYNGEKNIKAGFFSKHKYYLNYDISVFCLVPNNRKAVMKCKALMSKKAKKILAEFEEEDF